MDINEDVEIHQESERVEFVDTPHSHKVIYIAGPYRDPRGEFYVRCNIHEAERAALLVWKLGGVALCPHKNTAGMGGAHGLGEQVWLDGDLELLRRCDAMWVIGQWSISQGTLAEIAEAERLGLPVLRNMAAVARFLGMVRV